MFTSHRVHLVMFMEDICLHPRIEFTHVVNSDNVHHNLSVFDYM